MIESRITSQNYYYKFSTFLKERYGERVQKITINADFTCPNRDGTVGEGGCIYCNNHGFNVNIRQKPISIREQIIAGIDHGKKNKRSKFIAYFQAFSNTYATLDHLKKCYDEILPFDEIVGLSIGTRPDCIDEDKLALINSYTSDRMVWIEYGLQSVHDKTLQTINRGHDYAVFDRAIKLSSTYPDIFICVHMILGLPFETKEEMLKSASTIATLPIHGIKLHPLHIVKDTSLEKLFREKKFSPLSLPDYVELCCDFLERIPRHITVQRITADAPEALLIGPLWVSRKMATLNAIDNEFRRRGTQQGSRI